MSKKFLGHMKQLNNYGEEHRLDTDKSMANMFELLRWMKQVKFECLMLNRNALSFLIKDGRLALSLLSTGSGF